MMIVKDDSPPPAYSAIPSIDSSDPSTEAHVATTSQVQPQTPFPTEVFPQQQHQHQQQAYGPTPLVQQLQQGALLPYYDPRSPYAMQQAISRARWRFLGALLWAIGIYIAFGIVTGGIVIDIRRRKPPLLFISVSGLARHGNCNHSLIAVAVAQQQHLARTYPYFEISPASSSSSITVASTLAQSRSVPVPVHQHVGADEDFINRSLLDQIDTDADTDPVFSSDSEAAGAGKIVGSGRGRNFGSSSSQSSVESSGVSYPYQMQLPSQPPQRSDSPSGQRAGLVYGPRGGGDQFMHTPQQSLYNNPVSEPSSEFSPFPDGDNQQSTGAFDNSNFRNNSMYSSFLPPRARPSIGGPPSAGFVHETNSINYNQYNALSAAEVFGTHQSLAQLSQQQQQQQAANSRGYEYMSEAQVMKPNGKPMFNLDSFNAVPSGVTSTTIMQGHPLTKPPQAQAQQQQHLHNFVNQSFSNGVIQSQQAQQQPSFGPHIQPNHNAPVSGPSVSHANGLSNVTTQQEEISTIFVVGFPDDMQEREFQNMFTFSSGFEAATLKIPNKDSTAYGSNAPSSSTNTGRGSYQAGYQYPGASDPYNFLGGSDGRDGWTGDPGDPAGSGNQLPNNQQGSNPQPRKQIIGFAKFRTRSEALTARDLLQGRRIDIEKGAVLKAEMAKKNLHTKRGVGPLGPPLSVNVGGPGGVGGGIPNTMPGQHGGGLAGIPENVSAMTGMLSPGLGPTPEMLTARERELGTLGAMGLGGLTRRDRFESQDDDRENRRRREFGSVNSLANNLGALNIQGTRGPRERLEEDEREREKRRREKEAERLRLRAGNQAAYDAFHSVANAQRLPSLSTITSPSDGFSALPFSSLFSPQESVSSQSMDGWPIGPASSTQRVANVGIGANTGMNAARTATLGISTNLGNARSSPSQETSPTEPTPGPASVSSRSNASDHGVSQDAELFSPTPAVSLSSHPSTSSLSSRSRPYSPTTEGPTSSGVLPTLPEQQQVGAATQAQALPPVSTSDSSSTSGSRSSSGSIDEDVSRTMNTIDVSQQGAMSPQLPSPNSGSSSGLVSRGNPADQNPPINTLYVGNLPTSPIPGNQPNLLEDSLRSLFARCPGYRKLCFRQKSNGPMCFVEFEDVNYATRALSDLYGHTLNGLVKGGIRLSYSKNPLGVRTPTNVGNGGGFQQSLQALNSSPSSFPSLQEALSRQSAAGILSIDMAAIRGMRRDASEVTSPSQYFASSPPPPRFFSPPPSSGFGFTGQANAPALARSNNSSFTSTFSPFGPSTPPEMTPQSVPSESTETPKSTNESQSTPSLDLAHSG